MQKILKSLNINEQFTKGVKKPKVYDQIKQNIPHEPNYNLMADLLFLPDDKGFKYCLVVVDLYSDAFDIEPVKNKEPGTILAAFQKMFKRDYIEKPLASIRTDNGSEFKGSFNKYLYNQNILHRVSLPYRHKQLANVESLNKQLGRLFNGYMNSIEAETGKEYHHWTDVVDTVRTELNEFRQKGSKNIEHVVPLVKESKFKVGDIVHIALDYPENALGNKQSTANFRMGDFRFSKVPQKIIKVVDYPTGHRYIIDGLKNVSYSDYELLKSKETEEKYVIKEILGKKTIKKKLFYLVWWKGYPKSEATWEPASSLQEDIPDIEA